LFAVITLDVDVAANPRAAGHLEQKIGLRGVRVVVARERHIAGEAVLARRADHDRSVTTRERLRTTGVFREETRLGVLAVFAVLAVLPRRALKAVLPVYPIPPWSAGRPPLVDGHRRT